MRLSILIFTISLLTTILIEAQVISVNRFPLQDYYQNNNDAFLLGLPDNHLVMFWFDSLSSQIKYSQSDDGGNSWYSANSLVNIQLTEKYVDIKGVVLPSGRVLITYHSNIYYLVYSDDNCNSWSTPIVVPTRAGIIARRKIFQSSLDVKGNGQVCFIHSVSNAYDSKEAKGIFSISSSDGIYWTAADTIDLSGKNGHIINIDPAKDMLVYSDSTENDYDLFIRTSSDAGISWSEKTLFIGDTLSQFNPVGTKDENGKTWIFYNQEVATPFSGILQSDINYITSTDGGNNWSTPEKFTKYIGYDYIKSISIWNERPIISFKSGRDFNSTYGNYQIYFTLADISVDTNVPPFMYKFLHSSENPGPNQPYIIQALVDDDREILSVKLNTFRNPPGINESIDMYDDGAHYDSLAGDKIYGAAIIPQNYGDFISYNFLLQDDDMNYVELNGSYVSVPLVFASDSYLFDVNNFKLPIDNRGIIAAVNVNGQAGGRFDESVMLFSGGFFLSGLNNNTPWINAIASSSLLEDYQAGPIGSSTTDPFNKLYIIKSSDPPFGAAWQIYQYAVERGADFYDGNNDGMYNPIDLNNNNSWDTNEDRPDFLGDVTAWCVYNDGVPTSYRRWNDQQPMGIEIQQTVFAWGDNVIDPIDNMIFVRYRIINKGTVASRFEDVYYSSWADPDIGGTEGSQDDLVGSDILLNLGYVYNSGPDASYGSNPPALGIPFLQGPATYIPGETFIDNNGNQIYDDGIDTPLDSAYMNNGPVIGIKVLPGAKNQDISSFIHYINGDPTLNDPSSGVEARNYMLGRTRTGESIDPCTWAYGFVFSGVDCATVDPRFLYSGNPVNQTGWLNTLAADQRILANTGPFTLEENKPIDIIVCYLIGRGSSALNSVSVMKSISAEAIQIYNSNFTDIPTAVENQSAIITDYKLFQNYPNPFNPSTKIRFTIPSATLRQAQSDNRITLKIYDILGNEIAALVDEYKPAGSYEVEFDALKTLRATSLPSGIYFYRLQAGSFVETKKMILIK